METTQYPIIDTTIKKALELPTEKYYKTHLSLINCILPVKMTPMEIDTLAAFMALEGDIARDRFGTTARRMVMEELKLKPAGLSNYIGALLEKEFLNKDEHKRITILPILFPQHDNQMYIFKLINKTDNASN